MTQSLPDMPDAASADISAEAASIGAALLLADLHEAVAEASAQLAALTGATTVSVPLAPTVTAAQSPPVSEAPAEQVWPVATQPALLAPQAVQNASEAPGSSICPAPGAGPASSVDQTGLQAAIAATMPNPASPVAPSPGELPEARLAAAGASDTPVAAGPGLTVRGLTADAAVLAPPFFLPSQPTAAAMAAAEPAGAASRDGSATMPWPQLEPVPGAAADGMWNIGAAAGSFAGAASAQPTGPQTADSAWSGPAATAAAPATGWPSQASPSNDAAAAGSPPNLGSAAPPPRQASGPTGGDVFLDGTRVGRWLSDTLAREAGGPATGGTGFDPRLSPTWPGALQGNGG